MDIHGSSNEPHELDCKHCLICEHLIANTVSDLFFESICFFNKAKGFTKSNAAGLKLISFLKNPYPVNK